MMQSKDYSTRLRNMNTNNRQVSIYIFKEVVYTVRLYCVCFVFLSN